MAIVLMIFSPFTGWPSRYLGGHFVSIKKNGVSGNDLEAVQQVREADPIRYNL